MRAKSIAATIAACALAGGLFGCGRFQAAKVTATPPAVTPDGKPAPPPGPGPSGQPPTPPPGPGPSGQPAAHQASLCPAVGRFEVTNPADPTVTTAIEFSAKTETGVSVKLSDTETVVVDGQPHEVTLTGVTGKVSETGSCVEGSVSIVYSKEANGTREQVRAIQLEITADTVVVRDTLPTGAGPLSGTYRKPGAPAPVPGQGTGQNTNQITNAAATHDGKLCPAEGNFEIRRAEDQQVMATLQFSSKTDAGVTVKFESTETEIVDGQAHDRPNGGHKTGVCTAGLITITYVSAQNTKDREISIRADGADKMIVTETVAPGGVTTPISGTFTKAQAAPVR